MGRLLLSLIVGLVVAAVVRFGISINTWTVIHSGWSQSAERPSSLPSGDCRSWLESWRAGGPTARCQPCVAASPGNVSHHPADKGDRGSARDIYPGDIDTLFLPGYIIGVSCTVFHQFRKVASGNNDEVARFLRDKPQGGEYLAFDDENGQQLDFDLRAVGSRQSPEQKTEPRGRGRPRLGVIAREVTLLPSH